MIRSIFIKVRSTGGYLVALKYSMSALYGLNKGDVWWAASDLGWIVGHSFCCYGPLASRNTNVLFEVIMSNFKVY